MSRPATFNWPDVTAGDYESVTFVFYDDEAETIPSDLSGSTFRAEVRTGRGQDTTAAATISVEVSTNTVVLSLSPTQTRDLADNGRRYFWDLEETASGNPDTILEGTIKTVQDITR